MFEGYLYSCAQKREALKYALGAFGESAYQLMIFHLEDRYNLIIEGSPCSAIDDIEAALGDIAGTSADLIVTRMHAYLRATKPRISTNKT